MVIMCLQIVVSSGLIFSVNLTLVAGLSPLNYRVTVFRTEHSSYLELLFVLTVSPAVSRCGA